MRAPCSHLPPPSQPAVVAEAVQHQLNVVDQTVSASQQLTVKVPNLSCATWLFMTGLCTCRFVQPRPVTAAHLLVRNLGPRVVARDAMAGNGQARLCWPPLQQYWRKVAVHRNAARQLGRLQPCRRWKVRHYSGTAGQQQLWQHARGQQTRGALVLPCSERQVLDLLSPHVSACADGPSQERINDCSAAEMLCGTSSPRDRHL